MTPVDQTLAVLVRRARLDHDHELAQIATVLVAYRRAELDYLRGGDRGVTFDGPGDPWGRVFLWPQMDNGFVATSASIAAATTYHDTRNNE